MTLYVACNSCHRQFDALTHAGLLRCPQCSDAHAYQFVATGPRVVVMAD
jgi:protein-arginine kinase activator protein McsA